jgi:sRNA-binding carbon storage regulator CsrA
MGLRLSRYAETTHTDINRSRLTIETAEGPILIEIKDIRGAQVAIDIDAPRTMTITRDEIFHSD